MYEQRRDFLKNLISNKELLGIEIGGLDKPLVVRTELSEGSEILYADHLSTADLRTKYKADSTVNLNAIVEVDLVSESGDFANNLNGRLVDYVVASHVVEHIPNPIRWLQRLFDVLRPGGFVFLVVPDKRFTFDFQRPTTTFGEMLESFLSNKKIPSVKDVFDHLSSAVMIDASRVWSGVLGSEELVPLASNKDALKYAYEVHNDSTYRDVHISIFTPLSFFSIVERIIETQLVMLEVIGFEDTSINDIEFFVGLKKPEIDNDFTKQSCLASIPSLPLHSLTSPYMPQVKLLSESLKKITDVHQEFQISYARLDEEHQRQKIQIEAITKELMLSQKVLNRRSVRLMMTFIHTVFSIISLFKSKKN
jgi:SAM-dependent methyltransferase